MKRDFVFRMLLAVGICVLSAVVYFGLASLTEVVEAAPGKITQGALQILGKAGQSNGQCPLKHTDVKTEISGQLARTTVTQEFQNPFNDKIEAVYVFPLPVNAAVDDMTMIVGDRTIKGKIKRREEARAIYEAAREAGQVASLLDQERPNIFTQSVANITPGAVVKVTISYVETLKYEDGSYEFVFPMVVGPRYIPGQPTAQPNPVTAPDTSQVPDASRITPPIAPENTRAGHDISIEVKLDTGVPIDSINTKTHEVEEQRVNAHATIVRLKDQNTIPNKDFVLRFDVAGKKIADAMMTHRGQQGGFFTLMLQPPERITVADVSPKEIVFVLDTSGSMDGFPIEKAKESMKLAIDGMNPQDTFNLITFAGDTHVLFPQPVPATRENLNRARDFLASRSGGGGTEMMKAIRAALAPSDAQDHIRIVCFMTDGYVGNDMEIVGEVQKHPNARVFAFGIGSSVNRFLLDKMAEEGRGEVEYVSLNDDGSAAAKRFHERVRNPLLTDIRVEWGGLPVADVYPQRIPDLFSAKPLVLTGRYTNGARGTIRLIGRVGAQTFTRDIPVELPETQPEHDVLATLWARTRIDDLMRQDYSGIQNGSPKDEVKEAITQLGLEYRLMTQFTSFVAVEEMTVTEGGQPRRVDVPVELPEGVSREGIEGKSFEKLEISARLQRPSKVAYNNMIVAAPAPAMPASTPESYLRREAVSGGVMKDVAVSKVQPAYPATAKAAKISGPVQVQVVIDEAGKVIEAKAIGGHPMLRAAAVQAAKQWTFKPTQLSGIPVKTQGVVTFSFALDGTTSGSADSTKPLPEERRRQAALAKLHPSVAAIVARLAKKDTTPGADETKFVSNGKAELQIWLTNKPGAAVEQLKQLGFEIVLNPQSSKLIIGRLPIEKLEALAGLEVVRYVSPMTGLSRK
ncbi:MAG: TonB family protein [Acidobacteria bacterium]|nr:TonB family protein [Acidobacteriota bacterium]